MLLYGAKEVEELLGVSRTRAYIIIKEINKEMKLKGFLTLNGKVNKKYLVEKFGFSEEDLEVNNAGIQRR